MRNPPPELPADLAPFPPRRPAPLPNLAPPARLPDPPGMATKHMHVKCNPWELEQLAAIARRECVPMTSLVRRMVRANLLEQKR